MQDVMFLQQYSHCIMQQQMQLALCMPWSIASFLFSPDWAVVGSITSLQKETAGFVTFLQKDTAHYLFRLLIILTHCPFPLPVLLPGRVQFCSSFNVVSPCMLIPPKQ
eukprot:1160158-Pelagomonas_calceolata.AAC.9